MTPRICVLLGVANALVWAAALALPVFEFRTPVEGGRGDMPGVEYVLWGWYDVSAGTGYVWLAHPIWLFNNSLMLAGRRPIGMLAACGVVLAATGLVPFMGGQYEDIIQGPLNARLGVYAWICANVVTLFAAVLPAARDAARALRS